MGRQRQLPARSLRPRVAAVAAAEFRLLPARNPNSSFSVYTPTILNMTNHPDVTIIGGGIIGLTCAYFLAKEGLCVELFDRGELGQEASWAGAGIIPPGNPAGAATPLDRLRAIGSVRFPNLTSELRELTHLDNGYRRCGGIEFFDQNPDPILELWQQEGIRFEPLNREQLRRLEPAVEGVPGQPYLLPDCAQVRNPWHLRALIAACEQVGVILHRNTPLTAAEVVNARRCLIAAGAWSDAVLGATVSRLQVYPVRGQIVLLKPRVPLISRVLMVGKRYLVPRADGQVLIGSTEEPEAGFEKANTAQAVSDLISFACGLVPALATAELVKCWSGLRPGTADGLPYIGRVPDQENLFIATGHFRAGVQLSLGTAQAITELLMGRPTCVPLAAFAVGRPPARVSRNAFRS
jgi:glycine oxidase